MSDDPINSQSLSQAIEGAVVDEPTDVAQGLSALAEIAEAADRDPVVEDLLTQRRQALAALSGPRHSRFTYCVCLLLAGLAFAQAYLSMMVRSGALLAVAAATLVIAWMAWRKSNWMQFDLRTALVGMVVLSLPFAWTGSLLRRYAQEEAAVALLAEHWEGQCHRTFDHLPLWFRQRCPANWLPVFGHVDAVSLENSAFGDEQVAVLDSFHSLELLNLRGTQVTDVGVEHLMRHRQLHWLALGGTDVTAKSLVAVGPLPALVKLDVINTEVTIFEAREFRKRHPKVQVASGGRRRPAQTSGVQPHSIAGAFDDLQPEIERALEEAQKAILNPQNSSRSEEELQEPAENPGEITEAEFDSEFDPMPD